MVEKKDYKLEGPCVLIILDGWGVSKKREGNAILQAKTPVMDNLLAKYPSTTLSASGKDAGLPLKQDGNSEAGHMNIGAGRVVLQDSVIVSKSIRNGTFFRNPAFLQAIRNVKNKKSTLHLMGIISQDQSPHMSPGHLEALLKLGRLNDVKKVSLHLFTDGRDSLKYVAINLIKKLEKKLRPHEQISTIIGRYYMNRTKNWSLTEKAYNAIVQGQGRKAKSPQAAILQAYNSNESDEFVSPTVIYKDHIPPAQIDHDDSIIFFNLRSDRARQLTKPFVQKNFNKLNSAAFRRKKVLKNLIFVAMTDFGPDLEGVLTAYPSIDVHDTLPMALKRLRQLYIAEGEKYAHVTYFLNGGYADPVGRENRILVASIDVKDYEKKPEMSLKTLNHIVMESLKNKLYEFIAVNMANPDMIGHTGNFEAAIKAIEAVDQAVGEIVKEVLKQKGVAMITADHGNAEEVINQKTGEVDTKHSNNSVPFIVVSDHHPQVKKRKRLPGGILCNVAPTILHLMDVKKPKKMTCKSLFRK